MLKNLGLCMREIPNFKFDVKFNKIILTYLPFLAASPLYLL
jgi:hypothetical protein